MTESVSTTVNHVGGVDSFVFFPLTMTCTCSWFFFFLKPQLNTFPPRGSAEACYCNCWVITGRGWLEVRAVMVQTSCCVNTSTPSSLLCWVWDVCRCNSVVTCRKNSADVWRTHRKRNFTQSFFFNHLLKWNVWAFKANTWNVYCVYSHGYS